jgi:hypothetical protein
VVQFQGAIAQNGGEARIAELIRAGGGVAARRSDFELGLHLVSLAAGDSVEAAMARFRRMPEVAFAEPNYVQRLQRTPNDPLFGLQWNFRMLDSERVWDIQTGSSSVVVAVIDRGSPPRISALFVDYGPFGAGCWAALAGARLNTRITAGFNACSAPALRSTTTPRTHVASTIAEGPTTAWSRASG